MSGLTIIEKFDRPDASRLTARFIVRPRWRRRNGVIWVSGQVTMSAWQRDDGCKLTHVEDDVDERRDRQNVGDRGKSGVLSQRVPSERCLGLDEPARGEIRELSLGDGDESDLVRKNEAKSDRGPGTSES